MSKKKLIFSFLVFLALGNKIYSQVISMPFAESTNIFYGQKNTPFLGASSMSNIQVRFQPAFFCNIQFTLNSSVNDLVSFILTPDKKEGKGFFNLFGASLNFPSIKGIPISFGIFSGAYDRLGSDSILQEHLKTKISEPEFRKYYPASAFRPQNIVDGLGVATYGATNDGIYAGCYLAWNEQIGEELKLKIDTRMGGYFHPFSFDFFAGVSMPIDASLAKIRLGTIMLFQTDSDYEFFAELGLAPFQVKKVKPKDIAANFYGSFEARITRGIIKMAISCFVSPVFLMPKSIVDKSLKDSSFVGLSTMVTFGNLYLKKIEGGFSVLASVNPQKPAIITPFSFSISPFLTFKFDKLETDIRVPINPLLYKNLLEMLKVQITLKVVY